jgi:anti-sigma B factor antagonist
MSHRASAIHLTVRKVDPKVSIIDISGSVTAASENSLMDAYNEASSDSTCAIVLNFSDLEYLNSTGIGLIVTLLVRTNRQRQRLLAYGLNEHYRNIFEITRLTDAIGIHNDLSSTLAAASGA